MAQSSDEIIKREIYDMLNCVSKDIELRIFTQSSRDDQLPFSKGGLTFGVNGNYYGSCDAVWLVKDKWVDMIDNHISDLKPIIALEGTDALNRGSSGNAQTQRFHHALGAVRNGVVGIYFLKKGKLRIRPDLFGMAYFASKVEKGSYLVTDDLTVVKDLLERYSNPKAFSDYLISYLEKMHDIFLAEFNAVYGGDWNKFAEKRSTILGDDYVIKYAGRMRRNFTDSSQRAGHIAVGEMFLTKYYFYNKKFFYLFPKMTHKDLDILDKSKTADKEWFLLRNEPNVEIKTMDDIIGLDQSVKDVLLSIQDVPLKGDAMRTFNKCMETIIQGLKTKKLRLK